MKKKEYYTVKTVEIRRQFKTRPGKNPDTLAVELRQFSCRPEEMWFPYIYPNFIKKFQKLQKKINEKTIFVWHISFP